MIKYFLGLILLISFNLQADSGLSGKGLEFFKEKHINTINQHCSTNQDPKKCFINDMSHFYKGLRLLSQPHGVKYYQKCYDKNKENGYYNYNEINLCTKNYFNILSHDFLNKKYNHIFLEEGNILNNIAHNCNNINYSEINLTKINKCINKEQKSFTFFKLNFFNNQNKKVENVFKFCMEKFKISNYSFHFEKINNCIKQNTYNF
jgi:hypothetical protein